MSENGPEINPVKAKIARLKRKVEAGLLDPYSDPETQEEIRQANLRQLETTEEDGNPWEELPVSPDQDPQTSTAHLPRKFKGRPINQPVVTQASFEGLPAEKVMSAGSGTRGMKKPQPYERGRLGQDAPQDKQLANQQRFMIKKNMRTRGEDV